MSQLEELKVFVSQRLQAAASEILGAIERTVADYEEQASRLKEENQRNRSVLDMILQTKREAGRVNKSTSTAAVSSSAAAAAAAAAAGPGTSESTPPRPSQPAPRTRQTTFQSSELLCVFTSRAEFLKSAANNVCLYCIRGVEASEKHLLKRHYLSAVHFIENGTEKFVIPCMCKDLIQGRSHWHCPYCRKILYRKCNFEAHISKMHGYAILQQSQDTEMDQPSVSVLEEKVPSSPEPWCQQEFATLDQEDHQTSLLLQIKDEEDQEMLEQGIEEYHGQNSNIVCMGGFIQDLNKMESGRRDLLPNSSAVETLSDCGVGGIRESAGPFQHNTEADASEEWENNHRASLKALKSKRKNRIARFFPSASSKIKRPAQSSISQNHSGAYSCKACGKTFHYLYTLRTHVQTHMGDKPCVCGLCGKHLRASESLVQHIQTHSKRNKCGICGKQFSSHSRLKRHSRFHRPNIVSSS